MAGGIDWFRWHHGTVDEAKLRTAARRAGARVCEAVAMWAICMETASKAENRGSCAGLDFEVIDCTQEFEEGTAERLYRAFQGLTRPLVDEGDALAAWDKRQPKREREDNTAAERKRNQREREAAKPAQDTPAEAADARVTPRHTTSHQKTPRGEESREEKSSSPLRSEESPASRGCDDLLPEAGAAELVLVGAPTAPAPHKPKRRAQPKAESDSPSGRTFRAYSAAYVQRYGVEPVRNERVNAQIAQFVGRVGSDEAPEVAAFFVAHNKAFYVNALHAVGAMLADAEALRTQWATGRRVTATQAQQADKTQANGSAFSGLIAAARAREAKEKQDAALHDA